jgi:hypothetical protein
LNDIRADLLQEYNEILLKLAMDSFSVIKGKEFDLENEKIKSEDKLSISQAHKKKIDRLLNKHLITQSISIFIKGTSTVLKKISVLISIFVIIFGITIVNVDAARIKLLNLILDVEKEYTSIKLTNNKKGNVLGNSLYINWINSYAPTYIPNGYTVYNISNDNNMKFIEYRNMDKNLNDEPIVFIQMPTESKGNVDTENAKVVNIQIHGYDGILIEKNNFISIIWHNDEYLFDLSGYESKVQMIKIAESVKFLQ